MFYSVLVSRAALFDISSMAASFISIIMVSVGDTRVLCPRVVPACELCSHQVFPPPDHCVLRLTGDVSVAA